MKGKEWKGENKVFIEVDIPRINILFVESKKESEERWQVIIYWVYLQTFKNGTSIKIKIFDYRYFMVAQ